MGRVVLAQRELLDVPLLLPFGKTAPKITLNPGGGLVALLWGLREQLHDDLGNRGRGILRPLAGRRRLPCNMAVNPFHGIGRGKREAAGQHLIKRYAKCVEVAARVDRTVHSSGLFGRHICEGAGDRSGRLERLPLPRQARGYAEPGEPHSSVRTVDQDIGRLQVLVDQTTLVEFVQSNADADGNVQEAADLHRRAEQPLERLAARILEHEYGPTAFALKLQRPHSPRTVKLVPQSVFLIKAIDGGGEWVRGGGQHSQHGAAIAVSVQAPRSAENAFPVLPQDLGTVISLKG